MANTLILSNNNELLRLLPPDIVAITADRNYSEIITADGDHRTVVFQLGAIESQIATQLGSESTQFIRIGRSCIINRNYIYFINLARKQIILKSPNGKQHSLDAGHDALHQLKMFLEQESKNSQHTNE